jgi:preprotein translocase subunit SecD
MSLVTKALAGGLGLLGCIACVAAGGQVADKAGVKFELRRAETKPAEGLTEAMVQGTKQKVYLHKEIALTNKDVAGAQAKLDDGQRPAVEVTFTEEGRKKLARVTEQHRDRPLAILVDGKVLATPIVRGKISEGKAVITGDFTREKAEKIAKGLKGQ